MQPIARRCCDSSTRSDAGRVAPTFHFACDGLARECASVSRTTEVNSLDKEKARAIAKALLETEQQRLAASRRGRRVPFLVRSRASARLGRAREWELYRQARDNIFANQAASIAVACAPLVILVGAWLFMPHPVSAAYVLAMDSGLVIIPGGLVLIHLRRELARLARADESQNP
jgi:hypothetical protein